MQRRIFIRQSVALSAGLGLVGFSCNSSTKSETAQVADTTSQQKTTGANPLFKISLAEWSYHRALFGNPGTAKMDNLDFPRKARELGIEGVEFVNQFFKDKAKDTQYLAELKKICNSEGVTSVLIMCDGEGALGDPDQKVRMQAVENHYKWVEAAKYLGCHSIRVNAQSQGGYEEQQKLAAEGLGKLGEYAQKENIGVIVENHGGLSSNGEWLSGVMKAVDMPNVGTLPDFGNFCLERTNDGCKEEYDKYKGVAELMPYAKGVSAKTYNFNNEGQESDIDYMKMMKIVMDNNYHGFVGIEYEGEGLPEEEGVIATRDLLIKVRDKLNA